MPYLSVIIPVYNAEKYLDDCLESIKKQTFGDYEIIMVDDGSTDGSPRICDRHAEEDDRIRVIHVSNGGPSKARNIGFREAKGVYIYCIDNDDYISTCDYFQSIHDSISQMPVDLLQTGAVYIKDGASAPSKTLTFYPLDDETILHPERVLSVALTRVNYETSCWSKVIRREFLLEHELFFDETLTVEDFDWNMRMLPEIKRYNVLPIANYVHVYRRGSITAATGKRNFKNCEDQVVTIRRWSERFIADSGMDKNLKAGLLSFICYQYLITLGKCATLDEQHKTEIFRKLRELRHVLNYAHGAKPRLIMWIGRLFGLRAVAFLMGFYFNKMRHSA